MIFLKPEYLIYMLIPLIILFYLIITGKSPIQTIFDEKILRRLTIDTDSLGRTGRNFMLFVAMLFMIVALARPVLPKAEITTAAKSLDLLVALDISRSMLATDRYPDRLTFAKRKLYELMEKFKEARIGVIAFADEGFIVAPLTEDKASLRFLIDNLNTDALSTNGTDLRIPIRKAAEMLEKDKQKILVIFTDGGDGSDFSEEIAEAKKAGVTVYIYAVGTKRGAPIPWHGENLKDDSGNIAISRLNDRIKALAIETGGAYIEGGYRDKSVDMIIRDIRQKFKTMQRKSRKVQDFQELFYYPLTIAICFMLFAFSSLPKSSRAVLLLPLLLSLSPSDSHAGFLDFHEIKEGFRYYRAGSYRDAIRHFERVAASRRDAPSYYDLGNAYYRAGLYQKAVHAYSDAHTRDPKLRYKLFFNLGNAYYRLGKYAKALDAYLYARKFHTEPDLEYNIELARKHLKKQPPKSKPSDKKQKEQKKEQKKQQNRSQQKGSKNQKSQQPSQGSGKQRDTQKNGGENRSQKRTELSPQELKKWERRLQKSKPRTMPLRFRLEDAERKKNAKPW